MKTLAERLNAKANNVNVDTKGKEKNMEKKPETKVIKGIGNILMNMDNTNMVKFFAERMKGVYLQRASLTIRNSFPESIREYYFENVVKGSDIEYLANVFDKAVNTALDMAKGKKEVTEDYIDQLEGILAEHELKEYMERNMDKEYSFHELQEYIITTFEDTLKGMINLYRTITL
jgi:hypothetical protein